MAWIHRKGTPNRFRYVTDKGQPVTQKDRKRIHALVIPPAWRDVHIAASPRSPIQAWGYDVKGRKQYKYHENAVRRRELEKYHRIRQMASDLPKIRRSVARDLGKRGLPKDKVLAGVIHLISLGFFRVGSERYLKENKTFGITTLNKSHVQMEGDGGVLFSYIGKRSIRHRQVVVAPELAKFIQDLLNTPGKRLFRYNAEDRWHTINANDVNQYFHKISGGFPYTAKDLRTWGGTLRAATILAELGAPSSAAEGKRNVLNMIRMVAAELGNTPAICRKSYVHPVIIEQYLEKGVVIDWSRLKSGGRSGHSPEERALIKFLDQYFPERQRKDVS